MEDIASEQKVEINILDLRFLADSGVAHNHRRLVLNMDLRVNQVRKHFVAIGKPQQVKILELSLKYSNETLDWGYRYFLLAKFECQLLNNLFDT